MKKLVYTLKIKAKVFIIFCFLSSSLLAIEPEEEMSPLDSRTTVLTSRTREDFTRAPLPLPPPSRWSKLCSRAKGVGKSVLNLLAFQDTYQNLRESPTVKRVMRGVVHLGVGVGGILLSRQPTEEELASATFVDHAFRNARDMYYVKHCLLGARLILEPLLGPPLQRAFPNATNKMLSVYEKLPCVYQGTTNVIAGSGVIGYCRDMNSFSFSLPGYGLGAIFILRGSQRLLITVQGYDPLTPLHRYFKKNILEHFLFTSENSYLRRVMDGTAEIFAALTLHHSLWPFTYDEATDLISPLRKEQEAKWLAKCKDIIESGELPPEIVRSMNGQYLRYCRELLPPPLKNITSKQLLVATDHVCLLDNGNNLCGRVGKTGWRVTRDAADYAESLDWSPGWGSKALADIGHMNDTPIEKWYAYCDFGGIFKEGGDIVYVDKDYSRPFLLTISNSLDINQMFFRILTPWGKWFNFENRYAIALLANSWLESEKLFSLNTLGRFMLAHGMLEICRGLGGMVKAGYKASQAVFAYHVVRTAAGGDIVAPKTAPLIPKVLQTRRRFPKFTPSIPMYEPSSFDATSASHLSFQSTGGLPGTSEDEVPPRKKKVKTRKPSQGNDTSSEEEAFEKNEPHHPPLEVPEGLETALDHRMRTLKVEGFSRAVNELRTMGALVTVRGEFYNFLW